MAINLEHLQSITYIPPIAFPKQANIIRDAALAQLSFLGLNLKKINFVNLQKTEINYMLSRVPRISKKHVLMDWGGFEPYWVQTTNSFI